MKGPALVACLFMLGCGAARSSAQQRSTACSVARAACAVVEEACR